jgi:hypothetical protein
MRRRMPVVVLLGVGIALAPARFAQAQSNSFDALVNSLNAEDGVVCTSPPFIWLARLVVRAAQPEGVTDVRLATFEGSGLSRVAADASFGRLLDRVSKDGWSPLVRVRSRRSGEVSAVHVRHDRQHFSLLVVHIDRADAVVIEVSVLPETLTRWLDEPTQIARRTH